LVRYIGICMLMLFIWQVTAPESVNAQDKKGKLGSFEDANKGKKSGKDKDDDGDFGIDDGGCDCFFSIFELMISEMVESSEYVESEEYTDLYDDLTYEEESDSSYLTHSLAQPEDLAESEDYDASVEQETAELILREYSFGYYPYEPSGYVFETAVGKSFAGQLYFNYQYVDDQTSGYRFGGKIQLRQRHGIRFDLTDYQESLDQSTDHLQIVTLIYRYLIFGNDQFMIFPELGLKVLMPDNFVDADYGLNMGVGLNWFFAQPFSLEAGIGLAPIIDQMRNDDEDPVLIELQIGLGVHIQRFEIKGSYRSLIPSYDPDSAIYGPGLGIRVWF